MNRSERRERIVSLLYLKSMDGQFDSSAEETEIISALEDIWSHVSYLDDTIAKYLTGWTIDRLNYVDLAIIRNATYELLFTNLPAEVVIDEALELTKTYSNLDDDLAKGFNNKLLDSIYKGISKK